MAKYRKKPVTIEAIQYKGNNPTEIHDFVRKHMFRDIDGNLSIHTLEGDMKASIGDYIIRGVDGEFYPCKPDIFKKTYEKINIQPNNSTVNKQELAYRFLELPYVIKEQLMSKYGLVKEKYMCKEYADVIDKIIEDVQEKNCIDEFAKEVFKSR